MRLDSQNLLGRGPWFAKRIRKHEETEGPDIASFGLAESSQVLVSSILVHRPFSLYAGATAKAGTVLQAGEALVSAPLFSSAKELCGEMMVFQTPEYSGSANSQRGQNSKLLCGMMPEDAWKAIH